MWEGVQPRLVIASGLKPLPQKPLLQLEQATLFRRQRAFQPQQEFLHRQAAAEASGCNTNSTTFKPQRRTHFSMFSAADTAPVTM